MASDLDGAAGRVLPQGIDRIVLIVGCARSGTTWLQLLLNQHPAICTAQETNLFLYLSDLHRRWVEESREKRAVGLRALLDEERFRSLLVGFARTALLATFQIRQETRVVVEKTPLHVRHAELIDWLIPDAHFLHIVRDPRDVVGSLVRSGREWNPSWAELSVVDHAKRWVKDVTLGRSIAAWAGARYHEVRYEDLRANGVACLSGIFDWLQMKVTDRKTREWVEACELNQLQSSADGVRSPWRLDREPRSFWGERPRGAEGLSPSEIWAVERVCQPPMASFGYAPSRSVSLDALLPGFVRFHWSTKVRENARLLGRWLSGRRWMPERSPKNLTQ